MSDPITGVCVVEDKTRAPPDYEVIGFTTDNCDADLWKDKKMRKRITRYLAFTKKRIVGKDEVLADITVMKEEQMTPPGWTIITTTHDSGEVALKKKHIVVRFIKRSETNQAITEIFLTSGKSKNNKPVESSVRSWEIKDLSLFLRYGPVVQSGPPTVPSTTALPYQYPVRGDSLDATNSASPPAVSRVRSQLSRQGTMRSPEQMAHMSAIHGVPFQLNPVLVAAALPETISVTKLPLKTRDEILRAYEYDFSTERLVKRQAAFTS